MMMMMKGDIEVWKDAWWNEGVFSLISSVHIALIDVIRQYQNIVNFVVILIKYQSIWAIIECHQLMLI